LSKWQQSSSISSDILPAISSIEDGAIRASARLLGLAVEYRHSVICSDSSDEN
jgi:hypothetical protein